MRNWADVFQLLAVFFGAGGIVFGAASYNGTLAAVGIALALAMFWMHSLSAGLAEVFDYYKAANEARRKAAKVNAAKVQAAKADRAA